MATGCPLSFNLMYVFEALNLTAFISLVGVGFIYYFCEVVLEYLLSSYLVFERMKKEINST